MGSSTEFEFSGTSRFEIKRRIGSGGMGVVYEAFDRQREEAVALKRIRRFDATGLLRFKEEFRALHDLAHPNLVSLGELFDEGGEWFFTMELVRGVNFLTHVRLGLASGAESESMALTAEQLVSPSQDTLRAESPAAVAALAPVASFDEPTLRAAMKGLALGVAALHEAGKVHRDIKPSNIMVSPKGRVVLLDFGLVTQTMKSQDSTQAQAVGTAEYMAPEQGLSGAVGPAADWYSVGVVLYEALTGRLPHTGRTGLEILLARQHRTPTPPRAWRQDIPKDLDELCVDLLQLEPGDRPKAPEIFRRLGVDHEALGVAPRATHSGVSQSATFVGRHAELGALRAALERSAREPTIVLIEGDTGVGKSQLAEHFTEQLRATHPDVVALGGRCYERESVPYNAFDGIGDALSRFMVRLPRDEAAALLPLRAGLLPRLFQVLQRVEGIAKAPREPELPDPQEQRRRMFGALRELFVRLAKRRPVMLCIDDFQWADVDSLVLLRELLGHAESPPMLLVATLRTPLDDHRQAIIVGARETAATLELPLNVLSAEESQALAKVLLPKLADDEIDRFARETGGHPRFIHELARHVADGGTTERHPSLDETLLARVAHLPRRVRSLLEVVCVAGSPITHEVAAVAAEMEPAEQSRAARVLRAAYLVRTDGVRHSDTIVAYHDRIRELVLRALDDAARTRWHGRLALALQSVGAGESDPQSLVFHAAEAGDRAGAATYAEAAAEAAASAFAFDQAAGLYASALLLGNHDAEAARRLRLQLATALVNAGRGAEAAEAYVLAAEGAEQAVQLDCQRNAAEQWLISGHIERGLEAIETSLGEFGESLPKTPKRALLSLIKNRLRLRLRGMAWKVQTASEITHASLSRLAVLRAASQGLSMVDNVRGADFGARYLLLALRTGERRHLAGALGMEAVFLGSEGSKGCLRARRIIADMRKISASGGGDPYFSAWTHMVDGTVSYFEGNFRDGAASLEIAEREMAQVRVGTTFEQNGVRLCRLFCLRYLGDLATSRRLTAEYVRDARQRGDRYADTSLRRFAVTLAALVQDDVGRARAALDQDNWMPGSDAFHLQHWYELEARSELALYEREVSARLAELSEGFAKLARSLLTRVRVVRVASLWVRGRLLVASAREGAPIPRRELDKIIRALEREDVDYATVPALLLRAAGPLVGDQVSTEQRIGWLRHALELALAGDLRAHAEAARHRLGELVGGDEGAALLAETAGWMTEQGVGRPDAFLETLAPGFAAPTPALNP